MMVNDRRPKGSVRKNPVALLTGLVFLLVGIAILVGLYWIHTQQQAFASIALTSTGTVIEIEEHTSYPSNGKISTTYSPVIQFVTNTEHVQTFTPLAGRNPPGYAIGDHVEILYNSANPTEAVIAEANSISTNPSMMLIGVIGCILIIVGLVTLRSYVKGHRAA